MTNNIILTGIPRSGTTLTCYLLNRPPNSVALVEPLAPADFFGLSEKEIIYKMDTFISEQRDSILKDSIAISRTVAGEVTDNVVGNPDSVTKKREKVVDGKVFYLNKLVNHDFLLFIKQPSFFTSKISLLSKYYPCYAIIRNPLAVLLSWNSVEMAVTDGHAPAAESFDKFLFEKLSLIEDKFERQLFLLSWFYDRYNTYLPKNNIIKYEEIVSSNGNNILAKFDMNFFLTEKLLSRNNNRIYDLSLKEKLKELLLNSKGSYWKFYSKKEILF